MYKKNDVYDIVPVTTDNCKIYIYIYMMAVSLTLLKEDQNTKN